MSATEATFLDKLSSSLASIDLFGKAVHLNFNKGKKFRTRAGGFFTLFFFGFWIWSVYNVGKDIYQRKNPSMSTSEIIVQDPKPMVISPETFTIAFGYSEPLNGNHYKNNSIFTLKVTLQIMNRVTAADGTTTKIILNSNTSHLRSPYFPKTIEICNSSLFWNGSKGVPNIRRAARKGLTETLLDTETCTPAHFGELADNFATLQLDQLTCLKPTQSQMDSISIQGVYESEIWKYLQVAVLPCNSTTSAVTCGTKDEMDYYLGGQGFFAAYFTDMAVNTRNYEKPTTGYQNSIFTLFGNKGYKELYFMVDHVELTSDVGWFTKDENTKDYIKYETITETTTVASTDVLLRFQMKVSTNTKIFTRSYIKIPNIFAQANGLATVTLMVLLFIMTPYSNLKFNESIINELFEINSLNNPNSLVKKNSKAPGVSVDPKRFSSVLERSKTPQSVINPRTPTNRNFQPKPNNKKFRHFETIHSPKPLLDKISLSPSRIPNKKETQPSPETERFDPSLTSERISLSMKGTLMNLPLQTTENMPYSTENPLKTTESPKNTSILKNHKTLIGSSKTPQTKTGSFLSGPNSLSVNKPQYQKPGDHQPQDEPVEVKSLEIMLQGLPSVEPEKQEDQGLKILLPLRSDSNPNKNEEAHPNGQGEDKYEPLEDLEGQSPALEKHSSAERRYDQQMKSMALKMSKEDEGLNITFWDYLQSFVRRSNRYKHKVKLLNAGIKMINERLDIFEFFKYFHEIEKLKLLLLDYEQAVLFDNLPRPLLNVQENEGANYHKQLLKIGKLVSEEEKSTEVCEAFKALAIRRGEESSMIDVKLLRVYEERYKWK